MSRTTRTETHWRLFFVLISFVLAAILIAGRYFYLQIIEYRTYVTLAARQSGSKVEPIRRGTIFFQDKNGELISAAINKDAVTLVASPENIDDALEAATALSGIINIPIPELLAKFSGKNDPYEIILRKIDDEVASKVEALKLNGIFLERQPRRIYPADSIGAHVIGFVKFDNDIESGEYGIERAYETELAGETGIMGGITDPKDFITTIARRIVSPELNGKSVVLTIDANIEKRATSELAKVVKKYNAEGGTLTVVEPSSGRILALVGAPDFNPNTYGSAINYGVFLNRVVESNYELGSVMKPITMASAINEGAVTPISTYDDKGEVRIKGYRIQNFDGKAHGMQTMTNVLEKSLNTGAVFAERKLGDGKFVEYIKKFGFGEKAGINLPGEVAGNISNLETGHDIEFATAAFGQGIAVTPIQMTMALSAVANGGNLMQPYIVDKIVDDSGSAREFKPIVRRRVISEETSEALSKMLVSVVENGFEHRADIPGYFIAAKTGTAQMPADNGGGYSRDNFIHSFMGYAPAFKPRFLIFIQLVKPRGVNFASNSLTTTFHDLTSYIINYYGILPDRPI